MIVDRSSSRSVVFETWSSPIRRQHYEGETVDRYNLLCYAQTCDVAITCPQMLLLLTIVGAACGRAARALFVAARQMMRIEPRRARTHARASCAPLHAFDETFSCVVMDPDGD